MFEWLETTPVAIWVGESLWGYPIMLGAHVVGLAIVVGLFVMRDLRLLGMFPGISYASLDSLRNLGWTGFVINAVSGCFLFSSQASFFIENTAFLLKISNRPQWNLPVSYPKKALWHCRFWEGRVRTPRCPRPMPSR